MRWSPVVRVVVTLSLAWISLPEVAPANDVTPGVVFVLDGVGGLGRFPRAVAEAFEASGAGLEIRHHYWSHGLARWHADLTDDAHIEAQAKSLAEAIADQQVTDPDEPVYLVAWSGGTAVALEALERLPEGSVDSVVFLGSAVSPGRNLAPALRAVRTELVSYSSHRDAMVLGIGTHLFGTPDNKKVDAAGRVGFEVPDGLPLEEIAQYDKLRQVRWTRDMIADGNYGFHLSVHNHTFLRRHVVPAIADAG